MTGTKLENASMRFVARFISSQLPIFSVLVVEDNLVNQKLIERQLISLSQKVHTVSNGEEALKYLERTSSLPDLVITDKEMPVMDGIAFLRTVRAKEKWKNLYCILWSDTQHTTSQETYAELQVAQYLSKPLQKKELEQALDRFTQQKSK
jgi:CheY-like chemotaxis protein